MTEPDPTAVSLREYFEARLDSLALAVEKQEAAYNARFEGLNEWRATYGDLVSGAVTKDIFDARMSELARRINALEARQAAADGRMVGYSAGVGLVVLIISIVAQLLNLGG